MSRVSTRHFSAPRNWRKRIVNGLSSIASAPSRVPSVNKSKDTSIETQRQRASFSEQILIDYEAQLACESISSESSFVCSFNELWESRMSPYMMNQGVCTQSVRNCGQEVVTAVTLYKLNSSR